MNDLEMMALLDEVAENIVRTGRPIEWQEYLREAVKLQERAINTPVSLVERLRREAARPSSPRSQPNGIKKPPVGN